MKEVKIIGAEDVQVKEDLRSRCKIVDAKGPESMEVSDGFHTFTELYDHRIALFIALCKRINKDDELEKQMKMFREGFSFDHRGWIRRVWRSKLHSDGSSFDGWFVMGIDKEKGRQVTYHLPNAYWQLTDFAETLEKAPEFDGHTSTDVLIRIKDI